MYYCLDHVPGSFCNFLFIFLFLKKLFSRGNLNTTHFLKILTIWIRSKIHLIIKSRWFFSMFIPILNCFRLNNYTYMYMFVLFGIVCILNNWFWEPFKLWQNLLSIITLNSEILDGQQIFLIFQGGGQISKVIPSRW